MILHRDIPRVSVGSHADVVYSNVDPPKCRCCHLADPLDLRVIAHVRLDGYGINLSGWRRDRHWNEGWICTPPNALRLVSTTPGHWLPLGAIHVSPNMCPIDAHSRVILAWPGTEPMLVPVATKAPPDSVRRVVAHHPVLSGKMLTRRGSAG